MTQNLTREIKSLSAERALLGGIIKDAEFRQPVFAIITDAAFFYDYAHQLIYSAIRDMVGQGIEPELTALAERMHDTDLVREIGGLDYLAQLYMDATILNHLELARRIVDLAVRRNAIRATDEITKRLLDRSQPSYAVLMESSRQLSTLTFPLLSEQQAEESNMASYQPFPLDTLPVCVQEFITQTAKSMPCDPGLLVLPTICTLAACVGSKRAIQLKPGWVEKCILWGCTIAEPSSMKTPASEKCGMPLWRINGQLAKINDEAIAEYEGKMEDWRASTKGKKGESVVSAFKAMPKAPPVRLLAINDATIESLYQVLADNPSGIISWHDELRGWMKSMGRYTSGGGGGEEAAWLQFWSGGQGSIHRKGAGKKGITIANRHVGLYGTIQPETFARMMTQEQFENGMMARFLMAYPPRIIGEFTDDIVDEKVTDGYLQLCLDIFNDDAGQLDGDAWKPKLVNLTAAARRTWKQFYDQWQKRVATSDGAIAFSLKKLEAYAARLALLLCVVEFHWTQARVCTCTETHIQNAVRMVDWFECEMVRVYRMMRAKPDARNKERLIDLIGRNGGEMSPRQLMRSNSEKYPDVDAATKALDDLVKDGKGSWVEKPTSEKGGRPTKVFQIHKAA